MLAWFIYEWINWNTIVEMNFNALDQKLRFKNSIFINDFRMTLFLTINCSSCSILENLITSIFKNWKHSEVFQGWKSDSVLLRCDTVAEWLKCWLLSEQTQVRISLRTLFGYKARSIVMGLPQGRIQEFILGGAKPRSPIECWGRSPNRGREAPEYRGRSPSRGREAPENWGRSPNRGRSPKKKRGEGSGEGARWAPPQKFFEKSNLKTIHFGAYLRQLFEMTNKMV